MELLSLNLAPLAGWLVETTLQGSVLVALILLIRGLVHNRLPARWQYALWLVLLVRLSLPWAPQSRLSLYNLFQPQRWTSIVRSLSSSDAPTGHGMSNRSQAPEGKVAEQGIASSSPKAISGEESPQRHDVPATPVTAPAENPSGAAGSAQPRLISAQSLLECLWLTGAVVLAGYVLVQNLALWRVVRRERPVTDQQLLELLEDAKMQMRVQTILGIVVTDKVRSPALFGFIRPRLLLPEGLLETLSLDELHHVFLHELAHLKRRDIYIGWWTAILQILHWFNPLLWLAFRRMRADQEMAADALVLRQMAPEEPPAYGRTIVNLLERFSQPHYVPSVAGILEEPSQIERRMTMITRFKHIRHRSSVLGVLLIVVLASVSLPNAIGVRAAEVLAAESAPPITIHRVWSGHDVDSFGQVSPDGESLSYVDWDTGDLAVYEIATGQRRHLTDKGSWDANEAFAESSVWSPDGREIVYAWYNGQDAYELRVMNSSGGASRVLLSDPEYSWVHPCDWFGDGESILIWLSRKDDSQVVARLSLVDGALEILQRLPKGCHNVGLGPDEDTVVYDVPAKGDTATRDIFLLSLDSGEERALVKHPADERLLGWGPDREYLLFTSDRTGTPDIWTVKVTADGAAGEPRLIKSERGPSAPEGLGCTSEGVFYYCHVPYASDVRVAEIDLQAGEVAAPAREAIHHHVGSNATPDYSPDGECMAYISRRTPLRQRTNAVSLVGDVLCILSLETGEQRELRPQGLDRFGYPRWAPDGRSIMIVNWEENGSIAHYVIDPQTGEKTLVLRTQPPQRIHDHAWSTDGRSVFLVRGEDEEGMHLLARNIATGAETELLDGTWRDLFSISRSPDGHWLAVLGNGTNRELRIISTTGGEPRTIHSFQVMRDNRTIQHAWSADGRFILLQRPHPSTTDGKWEWWRIPVDGGQPERLELETGYASWVSVHPDGRHIAFSTPGSQHEVPTVWAMENFLPEAAAGVSASESTASMADNQPQFTKVRIPNKIWWDVQLSPDGNSIAFVNDSKLWIMPRTSTLGPGYPGTPRLLDTDDVQVSPAGFTWSADGRWIAFNSRTNDGLTPICVVPAAGGELRKVHENRFSVRTVSYRISLSPRGDKLAFASLDDGELHIYTRSLDGGSPTKLVDAQAREPVFSPDGTLIAYVEDKDAGRGGGGLWIVPATGGIPTLVADAGNASSPIWSPDGRMLAFIDDSASGQMHIVPVTQDGHFPNEKISISCPEGLTRFSRLARWTSDGQIAAVFATHQEFGLYKQPACGGKAGFVAHGGYPTQPHWSLDGKRIFHVNNTDESSGDWRNCAIAQVQAEGGEVTTVPLHSETEIRLWAYGAGNRVSPDGKTIVFAGQIPQEGRHAMHIWTLPVEGGTPTQITDVSEQFRDWYPSWSPDGQNIAFVRMESPKARFASIYVVPAEGGEPRQVASESDGVFSHAPVIWSPDGKLLAYFRQDQENPPDGTLNVIPAEGGEPRVITEVRRVLANKEMAWSPDGKRIAYNAPDNRIKIVSLEDGAIEEIKPDLKDVDIYHLDWSPDGESFVFAGYSGGGPEFWMVENFLPGAVVSAGK